MIIHRSAKVIEELFLSALQKITSPKSVKDTVYGTLLALAALFCLLFVFEQLIGR